MELYTVINFSKSFIAKMLLYNKISISEWIDTIKTGSYVSKACNLC